MAGENATDDDLDPMPIDDSAIDGAVDDLRGVLKKDAGDEPVVNDESVDSMSGAAAFGSDFGADFADGEASTGVDDPFNLGDAPDLGSPDLGAPGLGNPGMGVPDLGATDFGSVAGQGSGVAPQSPSQQKMGASGGNARVDLVLGHSHRCADHPRLQPDGGVLPDGALRRRDDRARSARSASRSRSWSTAS
jgi:flagellar motor switch protein FliN/FliY